MTNRTYGIEIEAFGMSMQVAAEAITAAGVACRVETYGHSAPRQWKIVTDGSVPHGFEVVSPILSGEEGFEEIRKVCRALNDAGGRVDRRCGYHVHVGARGLEASDIKNIINRYSTFERDIDSFMPPSRRGNDNSFCRSLVGWSRHVGSRFNSANTVDSVVRLMDSRYYKVNLQAYLRHGTIEFRQHSGTINGEKAVNWVKFCLNFVETSVVRMETVTSTSTSTTSTRRASTQAKYNRIVEMLRGNGATVEEISNAIGCSSASVIAMISKIRTELGYGIKKTRWSGRYRITSEAPAVASATSALEVALASRGFANAVATETRSRPVQVENDTWYRGLPAAIVSYYHERIVEVGGSN